ncbi:MAG: precorrin-6A/cobalt-precorrin-6A reductase [Pseudomonadota bacterium]
MRAVLILGGTAEARRVAEILGQRRLTQPSAPEPVLSLLGLTAAAAPPGVTLRRGGFGGPAGLAAEIQRLGAGAVIDATHPFAAQMPRRAREAAAAVDAPLLRLERPAWRPRLGEPWISAASLAHAAALIPPGARLFLAVGPGGAAPFRVRADRWCALRRAEASDAPFPLPHGRWVVGSPGDQASERALFSTLRVSGLVVKNSGGDRAKLDVAQDLGLTVWMIQRPARPPGGERAATVEEALVWLDALRAQGQF